MKGMNAYLNPKNSFQPRDKFIESRNAAVKNDSCSDGLLMSLKAYVGHDTLVLLCS